LNRLGKGVRKLEEEVVQEEKPETQVNVMAILSYLGPLCLIPLLTGEKDETVKFHVRQGMVLLIGEVIVWVVFGFLLGSMWRTWGFLGLMGMIQNLASLFLGILSIIGIINVISGQQKELPVVGKFAEKITFV